MLKYDTERMVFWADFTELHQTYFRTILQEPLEKWEISNVFNNTNDSQIKLISKWTTSNNMEVEI